MIHLVYGDDITKRQSEVDTLISSYRTKNFSFVRMEDSGFDTSSFLNTISSDGLFGEKRGVVLSHGLSDEEVRAFLESHAETLSSAHVPIIFVEGKMLKKEFPSFKKLFTSVIECKKVTQKNKPAFNTFSFVDAVAVGDRKKSWLLLQEARKQNLSAEELIPPLFWQYKTLMLVASGASAETLNMKPFVYSKAKKLNQKFSVQDVRKKLFTLITLFRDVRNSSEGFAHLETFVLNL